MSSLRLSLALALGRTLLSNLSGLVFGLGYLMAAFTQKKQTLHDKVVDSCVSVETNPSALKIFATILICLFGMFKVAPQLGLTGLKSKKVLTHSLRPINPSATDPCFGKTYCVMTYVTPWCPACKANAPFMKQLAEYLKTSSTSNVGYKIVIGQDEIFKLEEEARGLGDMSYLDTDGRFAKSLEIASYPTWLVYKNSDKQIVHQLKSGVPNRLLTKVEMDTYVPQFLKLDTKTINSP